MLVIVCTGQSSTITSESRQTAHTASDPLEVSCAGTPIAGLCAESVLKGEVSYPKEGDESTTNASDLIVTPHMGCFCTD